MKLLFLTQYFPPEMGAPQARIFELAIRLQKIGHEISVITAMPNYPTGTIFDGYKKKYYIKEDINGISVLRCWIYPSKSTGFLKRLLSYFSFVLSSMFYSPKHFNKHDIIVVESPPLFLGLAGVYLSRRFNSKLIFNVSDLWPDSAIELGVVKNKMLTFLAKKLESYCYKRSSAITGQSPTIIDTIRTRSSLKPIELITNGVDLKKFNPKYADPKIKETFNFENKIVFVYAGLFGIAQGLDQILDAAALTRGENKVRFLLIGDGPESSSLKERVEKESLDNVRIIPPVLKDEIPKILSSMDVALITLKVSLKGAVPSKIYEAMASGLPILFVGDGDGVKIIQDNNIGKIVKPYDIHNLVHVINELASKDELRRALSMNSLKAASLYSRDNIAEKFNKLLISLQN